MLINLKKTIFFSQFTLLFIFLFNSASFAQQKDDGTKTRILFIFDESYSMNSFWDTGKKIDIAKTLMIKLVDSLKNLENIELALRMYGHQSPAKPQDCNDTKLEVPFGENNIEIIKRKLKLTRPMGTTPIARSLEDCGNDFPPCSNCRNIIILITDGIEACSGDPCKIALTLHKKGIKLKPFIIGIGLDVDFKEAFECIGQFYNATKEEEFEQILNDVIKKAVNRTTAQINLLNTKGLPKETNVNITLYNQKNGKIFKNLIHTLNGKGLPDTLTLPTHITYKMEVHTIPSVTTGNIKLKERVHSTISAKTPQGTLNIIQKGGLELKGVKYIIKKSGSLKTLHTGELFEPEKYLTGKYDLEILTYPRTYIKNVVISQSKTNTVSIEQPGLAKILKPGPGYGGIYHIDKGKLLLIKTFTKSLKENIYLRPGEYIIVYRPQKVTSASFSRERRISIKPGRSLNVNFN